MKRWLISLAAVALVGCGGMNEQQPTVAPQLASWSESKELVVLVQNGPTSLYIDAEGNYAGLEYDLVTRFAQSNGLKVRFVVESSYSNLMRRLQRHEAHLAVGVHADEHVAAVSFGPSYQSVSPVLVYRSSLTESAALAKLYSGEASLRTLPQYVAALNQQQKSHPALKWQVDEDTDSEGLMQAVASGQLDYALVDSHAADVAQNYFPQVAATDGISDPQALAWAMTSGDTQLQGLVKQFFGTITADGTLNRYMDRYYGHVNRLDQLDAQAFLSRRSSVLPEFKRWFQQAQDKTGIDWRLVAALAYQESHWDPTAVSPYGVRGLMMLTTQTALRMGVDRLDPKQSIMGGARYISTMRDSIAATIAEPDRTWLALAAYNVGLGHLEDARELARKLKKNPDSWADVKTTLPLLRNPKYFSQTRYGYARGGEPVIFVESLRTYYDILARFEPSTALAADTSPALSSDIEVRNPKNLRLGINNQLQPAKADKADKAPLARVASAGARLQQVAMAH
ncbi:membrane-bound lytic murein transglycosylase MltF [Silvimonas sp. JCM 19000]